MPWWVFLGGGALLIYLMMKGKTPKTAPSTQPGTNMVIMPTSGWGYTPLTTATFAKWCAACKGVQMSATKCAVSGKGVFTLSNSRIKDPSGNWCLDDDIL
jgi:hypothetical protein